MIDRKDLCGKRQECRFWNPLREKKGECRHDSPDLTLKNVEEDCTSWPITKEDDWCGVHEPKEWDAPIEHCQVCGKGYEMDGSAYQDEGYCSRECVKKEREGNDD